MGIKGSTNRVSIKWYNTSVSNKIVLGSYISANVNLVDYKLKVELNNKVIFNTYDKSREEVQNLMNIALILNSYGTNIMCDISGSDTVFFGKIRWKNSICIQCKDNNAEDRVYRVWLEKR
jgi:glycyl-tRNA synthetase alpha subunit